MNDPLASRDNQHSFAGLYGIANPTVMWLIGRGYGELVALTPSEMREAAVAPRCPKRHAETTFMRYRGSEWVCYEHKTPVRVKIPPRLQKIPPPPFSTFDVIGKTVEVVYRRLDGEAKARWVYVVDGEVW